ncbi:PAS domain S-box protein, partial [Thermodesulfobacteriota bacterium]
VDTKIKHAVYHPIRLGNTLWSIVIEIPEREIISIMRGFRNRLFLIVGLLLVVGLMYAYFVIKAWAVLKEEEKRKKAEDALRESENKYRTLTNNLNVGVYRNTVGPKGKFIEANPAIVRLFGYDSREEFLQVNVSDLYENPDDRKKYNEKMIQNGAVINTEEQLRKKDGTPFIASISAVTVKDENGEVKYYDGVVEDITERKLFETTLQESEEKYRNILESIEEGYFEVDLAGNFTLVNDALCKYLGYPREELLGMNNRDITSPETAKNIYRIFNQVYETGTPAKISEFEFFAKNGENRFYELSASLIRNRGGNPSGFRGLARDTTERQAAEVEKKKLEIQLQQAQKMEAVGTLAGGVAHDFNNLLMGIQGRVSLMSTDVETSHPHAEHLKGIEDYVNSAADLTRQLLGFARGGKYEINVVDLNNLIQNQNRLFARTSKEIDIREKFEKNLWTTAVDQGQIEQMLLNMYLNAWQAMPGGGEMYIRTENVIIDESYVQPYEIKPGNYVKISITDTGIGMDAATQQRIFEPFFTTKDMGRGTGLGLASAYGIIKNHDGFVNVYSEKGEGTTFTIYLPATDKAPLKEKHPPRKTLEGSETVLLVDDEDIIIEVGRAIIESLGYTVLIAAGGEEAVDIYRKSADKIDIVVLDMIMPGMGGGEVYDRLKEINPNIKVLLSSGYSINGQATKILERGCDGFIQKPFNIMDLSIRIREILDKK